MKRIAVILRGHIRTWYQYAQRNFNHFNNIADQVDYYAVTWRNAYEYQSIIDLGVCFRDHGETLKQVLRLDENSLDNHYNSYNGAALMCNVITPYIDLEHRLTPYDAVVETRFDISYHWDKQYPVVWPDQNTVLTSGFTLQPCPNKGTDIIGTEDHYFMYTPENLRVMNSRIAWDTKEYNSHFAIYQYLAAQNIYLNKIKSYSASITRPDMAENCRNIDNIYHAMPMSKWNNISKPERRDILDKHNIPHNDYITQHTFISVE